MNHAALFDFMAERHAIWRRRAAGQSAPWTSDPILGTYRFTNVYRELDRVTSWYRENLREKLDDIELVRATLRFRWLNRDDLGEELINAYGTDPFARWDLAKLEEAIRYFRPDGPWVTGAFIVRTPSGDNKLSGVMTVLSGLERRLGWFYTTLQRAETMEWAFATLYRGRPRYVGHFTLYEVLCDFRFTDLFNPTDTRSWANPGPGAARGLARLNGRAPVPGRGAGTPNRSESVLMMRTLYQLARGDRALMDAVREPGLPFEMREIEHQLCEFDKYERARLDQGRPRQKLPKASRVATL